MKAYKGFNKDLQCDPTGNDPFQYEIGKTYEIANADLCREGFHACEDPIDVFAYYPPADSRYCEVELDDVSDQRDNDSKRVGRKITIGAEIGIPGIVKAHVEYVKSRIDPEKEQSIIGTGNRSAATNTGNRSAATNTGDLSAATNTGDRSAATNTGDWSAATNTGNRSAATNTGDLSAATNTGNRSAACVSGNDSVAIVTGIGSKVKGALGCGIVAVERGKWNGNAYPLLAICSAIVDGEKIKPDVWYTVRGGKFVEAEK